MKQTSTTPFDSIGPDAHAETQVNTLTIVTQDQADFAWLMDFSVVSVSF